MDKRALCAFDDKRFVLEDGVHTLAYGHKSITAHVEDTEEPELVNDIVLSSAEATRTRPPMEEAVEFPIGQEPQSVAAEAQITEHLTSMSSAPPATLPDSVADRIICFARYSRIPVQMVEGLTSHQVQALKEFARGEIARNTQEDEIRGTLMQLITTLRAQEDQDLAPVERIIDSLHAN